MRYLCVGLGQIQRQIVVGKWYLDSVPTVKQPQLE